MKRLYESIVESHLQQYDKMLFLAGPRQVGKTTISLSIKSKQHPAIYLNWDNYDHQTLILDGPESVAHRFKLHEISMHKKIIIFDEIHKYNHWKNFLKGFYDSYHQHTNIIVTGSAKLDVYKMGGDSMMGRYFIYRIHPLSIAECVRTTVSDTVIAPPIKISRQIFTRLLTFGGFPEPFVQGNKRFYNRWQRLWQQQLFREDLRDLTRIQEIAQIQLLATLLKQQTGQLINYNSLATKVQVSTPTIKKWLHTLNILYYCFTVTPWSSNISHALIKQPKVYLWDWSDLTDIGARLENFVAVHLLKAVHFWTDHGLGNYQLFFIRDKQKREVDFLITKDKKPWIVLEVKQSRNHAVSKSLYYFQQQTGAAHAFQIVFDMDYVDKDCFHYTEPVIVPAQTFLSQLV